jgi:hypothetical protein
VASQVARPLSSADLVLPPAPQPHDAVKFGGVTATTPRSKYIRLDAFGFGLEAHQAVFKLQKWWNKYFRVLNNKR